MELPKLIAVTGTNASGKTPVGIELAKAFNGEIISADSRQVFKGFDLCSGKVTPEEKQSIPHHLIDILSIGEPFSVADYQSLVYSLVPQILARGKTPFIVGGTGLYVNSVIYGYTLHKEIPNFELRAKLEELSVEELQSRLNKEGREFLASRPSDLQNKRRVIRVLEKTLLGEPLEYENIPVYDALLLGVTWPKEVLHNRIEDRLEQRVKQGMLDEVKRYLDDGGNPGHLYGLGLEYRYILWYLTGKYASYDEFFTEMSGAIKRFAKRQLTWYRKNKSIIWLDTNNDYISQAWELTGRFLQQGG